MMVRVCLMAVWMAAAAAAAAMMVAEGYWCIARSGATTPALQSALDYACGSGADCAPIQPSGLCYLPNTLAAHSSYAFNSYYQRSNLAPASCDFAGTAILSISDPSYGSCTYPSSPSSAGGTTPPGSPNATGTTTPAPGNTSIPPPSFGIGGLTPPPPPFVGSPGLTPPAVNGGLLPSVDTSASAAADKLRLPPLPFPAAALCWLLPINFVQQYVGAYWAWLVLHMFLI